MKDVVDGWVRTMKVDQYMHSARLQLDVPDDINRPSEGVIQIVLKGRVIQRFNAEMTTELILRHLHYLISIEVEAGRL